ncbi:RNA-guided endonuclease TnpB family protein, partial [Bariatricus sp. SGI.161]
RNAYTTNLVNGNIRIFENGIKLPKAGVVKAKIHRQIPEGFRMKAVTVRKQPSGKYYVSILFEYCADENQVRDREGRE